MSLNSSYSPNADISPDPSSSNFSFDSDTNSCLSIADQTIYATLNVLKVVLLLPLCILVLLVGHQQWQQCCNATMNHSDFFTYHFVATEIIGLFGCFLNFYTIYKDIPEITSLGTLIFILTTPVQLFCHCSTCIERYLAVIHPITYLDLRSSGGVRIRNISIACVWLLSFGWFGLMILPIIELFIIPLLFMLFFSLIVVSFCSLSVLCALKSPGPGEGDREKVNHSKQRAFYTIMTIMGVLLLWFVGLLVCVVLTVWNVVSSDQCMVLMSGFLFSLPSSLVLPLLFLHRTGKLQCCLYNAQQEQGLD